MEPNPEDTVGDTVVDIGEVIEAVDEAILHTSPEVLPLRM